MAHEETSDSVSNPPGGIAVVGMAGRFPGARDLDAFWRIIRDGIETISFFTDEQLTAMGVDPQVVKHASYVKARGTVEDIDQFDAAFFGYSHREALLMDPQQRLFLQLSWEALEAAGYDPKSYRGLIGVYGGSTASSYQPMLYANPDGLGGADGLSIAIGNELPFLTTRVSYKLDLKGPSCPVQTACSTSLVAVHLACQGLLNAECDMALAGGVSLRLPQESGYFYQEESILSPDGHCRSFDANAAGTIFSNGIGIVVLKRVEDALADGDTIYAVIRGSAINNDGSRRASFTAPGVTGQSQVIADALASAEVDPDTINYIEAHGTATSLGDSIEIQALTKAFGTARRGYCAIGSVKANIGHLDAAAGVAGLIKTILALRNKQLPPTAHFERPNPDIHFEATPFYVNGALREWKQPEDGPRRAGVSSFGFGGTNAHVVLEEAPAAEPSGSSRAWQVLAFSAEAPDVLDKITSNLAEHFTRRRADFADAAYTLKIGRRAFKHRRVAICQSAEDASRVLEGRDAKTVFTATHDGPPRRAVFMFPGQGSQYVNMGRELYEQEPLFTEIVDRASKTLRPHLGFDLRDALYPAQPSDDATARLTKTSVAQPALFVIEYATAKLLMSWGVKPDACIGHSVGEFVAACLAGVMSEDDALRLVALRGRLMEDMPAGAMLAIPLPEARVSRLLGDGLWLAAVNHASLTVVSGSHASIEQLEKRLQDEGVESQRLHTSHAFHSGMMDAAVAPFVDAVRAVALKAPEIPYISNVSGTWIQASEATDPAYWGKQIREAVRFAAGVAELLQKADRVYVEAGPGNTLGTLVRRQATAKIAQSVFSTLRHAREDGSDCASTLNALGRLWASGVAVDWDAFYTDETRRRVALPPYPFNGQKYWPAPPSAARRQASASQREKPQGRVSDIDAWFYVPTWRQERVPLSIGAPTDAGKDTWVVCLDRNGAGQQIVDRLAAIGHDVVAIESSDRFRRIGPGRFAIDPTSRDDYAVVLRELSASNRVPAVVLHMFGVAEVSDADAGVRDYVSDLTSGFASLLALAQALNNADLSSPIRLAVVTNDAFDVTGHETVAPGKAIALGLCKVIPQEYPTISCGCIDLTWNGQGLQLDRTTIDRVVHDAGRSSSAVVAYRGGQRWVLSYSELPLGELPAVPPRLQPQGVYLITGGLGDMGLNMAKFLVKSVQARVVLTGRTRLPEAADWDQYVAVNSPHDPIVQRILRLKELKALGGDVLIVKADAADLNEMRGAFDKAERKFGRVNGVIHAAGLVAGDAFRPISETDAELYGRQFQPKVAGLCVLDEILAERPVDFCVLISSLSSLLGGLRYAAYASANAFMDAFAFRRNRTSSFPWMTINWDNWMRTEDEVRLAESGAQPSGFVMTPTEGIDAFRRLLSADWGVQMVVSTGDLQARLDQWVQMTGLKDDEPASQMQHARPNLQTEYIAPRTELEKSIAKIWQELLGVDRVGVNDNFFELGGDSFLGIQVISRLKRQLGVKVSAVTLYEGPRVGLLADIINASAEQKAPAFDSSRQRGERRRGRKMGSETEVLGA